MMPTTDIRQQGLDSILVLAQADSSKSPTYKDTPIPHFLSSTRQVAHKYDR